MDKSILELFAKLLGSQNNTINQSNNVYTNPSYANYPHEAYASSMSANQSQQNSNNLNFLSSLLNNNNSDSNLLPLLLSMLGKNNNGLTGILEALSKKPTENQNKSDDTPSSPNDNDQINNKILL